MSCETPNAPNQDGFCSPATCRLRCGQETLDGLLRELAASRSEHLDAVLELKWLLLQREDAEQTLKVFCQVRQRLERGHYLAFYRLRRWLENQVEASVQPNRCATARRARISLTPVSLEGIRGYCVASSVQPTDLQLGPRVRFAFREPAEAGTVAGNAAELTA
jgi:hypothetical protein